MDYLVSHLEKSEESAADNSGQRVKEAATNFMESYILNDTYYDEAIDLAAYMGEQDVDMIHSVLLCNQALQDRKPRPRPRPRLRRERKPSRLELQIKDPL